MNYGVISSMSLDPIEKKPLYHYYPGSQIFSIGTLGCNLHCPFCQNYQISRYFEENTNRFFAQFSSEQILELAKKNIAASPSCFKGIAYTYSEPLIAYETVRECSELFKNNGFRNILVTNGFINSKPLKELLPFIDAANIDLKAYTEENYKKLGGRLKPVLETIAAFKNAGIHIEITTLLVTGLNDRMEELESLVKWIEKLDKNIPLHISRYFPQYHYQEPPTDLHFMEAVKKMASSYLHYVYLGNIPGESSTFCPKCKNLLIERINYQTNIKGLINQSCSQCGRKADIIL